MNFRYKHDMRLSTLMRFLSFETDLLLPGSNIHNHKFVSSFSRQHGHSSDWEKYLNTKRRGLEYIKKEMCHDFIIYTEVSSMFIGFLFMSLSMEPDVVLSLTTPAEGKWALLFSTLFGNDFAPINWLKFFKVMGCLLSAEDRQHYDMESGIRKRNHGNGNRNGNGIRKERFQAINLKKYILAMTIK